MSTGHFRPRECVQEILPYQPGKPIEQVQREFGLRRVIKLASNENPLGASPRAKQAAAAALKHMALYPDGSGWLLRRTLAKRLGLGPEQILLGNGSNELLVQLGVAYLNAGDEVLTSEMSFSVYATTAQLMNARLVQVPMKHYTFDLDAMAAALTPRTRLIFIANPNNPTGTAVAPEALRRFVERVPETCLVVLDEAYREYADRGRLGDSLAWVKAGRSNLVVLWTFSKCYGLAGLRVGYGVAAPEVVQTLDRVREPFNVNSVAQAAAVAALGDQAHVRRSVALARRERGWLHAQLTALGFEAVPSQANFVFARTPSGDGQALFQALQRRGVIIRPVGGAFIRVTAGTHAQNEKLVQELKKVL
jgi:histidinol-phosphate aminotransferase